MIVSYTNYLDQSQSLGVNTLIEYHSACVDVITPYPLSISLSKSHEYGIVISKAHEYGITMSHIGGGS